jgi:hypothetical protein
MRSIPVDVSAFTGFMCVNPPEPKVANLDTGEVRKDRVSGQTMFVVGVVAMRGRDSSVIQVNVPGEPGGLGVGTALRLVGLEAAPWDRDGRSGVSFRAVAVTPLEMTGTDSGPGRRGGPAPLAPPASGRGGDAS